MDLVQIPAAEMEAEFFRILSDSGFPEEDARVCAKLFTDNSLEGVYTHGVNRFPRFIDYIGKGFIKVDQKAICAHSSGAIEQWDGQLGPGPINALRCTDRALALSDEFGIGCVALSHTNHWMRGGAYGWRAARAGYAFIAWTNTVANTPAWGAKDARLGNNPLVFAAPYNGEAVVVDMAMSQFSYGAMEMFKMKGQRLPVPGGYDVAGNLTDDPEAILESQRTLPVGYWKGAALSLLLDLLATILSGGQSTAKISRAPAEYDVSQVFLAINLSRLSHANVIPSLTREIIEDYQRSEPADGGEGIRYPGQKALFLRGENLKNGIPVQKEVWESILKL